MTTAEKIEAALPILEHGPNYHQRFKTHQVLRSCNSVSQESEWVGPLKGIRRELRSHVGMIRRWKFQLRPQIVKNILLTSQGTPDVRPDAVDVDMKLVLRSVLSGVYSEAHHIPCNRCLEQVDKIGSRRPSVIEVIG